MKPDLLNIPTATINASSVGNNSIIIFSPSITPFKKISNIFFFSIIPKNIVIKIKNKIAVFPQNSINFILSPISDINFLYKYECIAFLLYKKYHIITKLYDIKTINISFHYSFSTINSIVISSLAGIAS